MKYCLFLILFFYAVLAYAQLADRDKLKPYKLPEGNSDSLTIADIRLEHNRKTHDYVIYREIRFKKGDKIARQDLEKVLNKENSKVFNTDLFVSSEITPEAAGKDSINLVVDVLEKWYFYPIPIFELGDRNFNEWWNQHQRDLSRLNYGLRFRQQNFRGRNEDLRFIVQFGFTQQFGIEYRIPYIDRRKTMGLSLRTTYSNNNRIAYRTNQDSNRLDFINQDKALRHTFATHLTLSKRAHFYNQSHFTLEYQRITIDDSVAELNPNYLGNYKTTLQYLGFQYTFERDLRDAIGYPLKGFILRLIAHQRGFGILSDLNRLELRGLYAHFFRLSKSRFYFSTSGRFQFTIPERLPYIEMRGFGYGEYFIRGYENNVIDAQRYLLWKNTLKFELFNSKLNLQKLIPLEQFNTIPLAIYLKIYADGGYTYNSLIERKPNNYANQFIGGTGAGIDIVTYYNMAWRFEYSLNRHGQHGWVFGMKADF